MSPDEIRKLSQILKLPALIGDSLNEIQQAEQIRSEKLKQVPYFDQNWDVFLKELEVRSLSEGSLKDLKNSDAAQFWIENRELNFWELLKWFE